MRKVLITLGLLATASCFFVSQVAAHAETDPNRIIIHVEDRGLFPTAIDIKPGQVVVLENVGKLDKWFVLEGDAYTGFDPDKKLAPGQELDVQFPNSGRWNLFDSGSPQFYTKITVAEPIVLSSPVTAPSASSLPTIIKIDGQFLLNILKLPINLLPSENNRTLFGRILTAISSFSAHTVIMEMGEDSYSPVDITIPLNSTITFRNVSSEDRWPASDDHPTHQNYGQTKEGTFDVGKPMPTGKEWQFVFSKAGEWGYHDHLRPDIVGKITVTDASSAQSNISTGVNFFKSVINAISTQDVATQLDYKSDYTAPAADPGFEQLSLEFKVACGAGDFKCFTTDFRAVTEKYGPNTAMEYYSQLRDRKLINPGMIDEHMLIHHIGRQTAETFGINQDGFILCPQTFIYGCQHGYLEYAMARIPDIKDVVAVTCGKMAAGGFTKVEIGGCYHGMGHAIMMANGNDIYKSLDICKTLGSGDVDNSCAQGVFMENAALPELKEEREGIFSADDPLAPCSQLPDAYTEFAYECYINHHGYLMYLYNLDIDKTIAACNKEEDNLVGRTACFQGIGLMVGTNHWYRFLPHDPKQELIVNAWALCQRFPLENVQDCIYGVLANIQNFEILNTKTTDRFCNLVARPYQLLCYRFIGYDLANRNADNLKKYEICTNLKTDADKKQECLTASQFSPISSN